MSDVWPLTGPNDSPPESDLTSDSPRTALLTPPFIDDASLDRLDDNELDPELTRPHRIPRGPGKRFRTERERAHSGTTKGDLLRLLIAEEYESRQTRKVLYTVFDRLDAESRRASEAEKQTSQVFDTIRRLREDLSRTQADAATAKEELKLYQLQLRNAQEEINKAQEVVKTLERQRDDAEDAAARGRAAVRRLNEARLVEQAREEGHKLGFEEGLRRGRHVGYNEGVDNGREEMREHAEQALDRMVQEQGEVQSGERTPPMEEEEEEDLDVEGNADDLVNRPPTDGTPDILRMSSSIPSSLQSNGPTPGPSPRSVHHIRPPPSPSTRTQSLSELSPASSEYPPMRPPSQSSYVPPRPPSQPQYPVRPPSSGSHHRRSHSHQQQPQSWPEPPVRPPSAPISVQNVPHSVHHPQTYIPPDGYIPTKDESGISLPPPHEFYMGVPSAPSSATSTVPPAPPPAVPPPGIPSVPSDGSDLAPLRDPAYDPPYPPFEIPNPRGRASPDLDSQSSAHRSQTSSISQLDLVGLPGATPVMGPARRRERELRDRDPNRMRGLSVIHEDAGSQRSSSMGSVPMVAGEIPVTPGASGSRRTRKESYGSSARGSPRRGGGEEDSDTMSIYEMRDRQAKQRLADELRYSDPSKVEEWRRSGSSRSRTQSVGSSARHRPSHVTVPTPLSPPQQAPAPPTEYVNPRHRRVQSLAATSQPQPPPPPQPQPQSQTSPSHLRPPSQSGQQRPDPGRRLSSDSSVPGITIQPPSNPPSDAPSRRSNRPAPQPQAHLLSPDQAPTPLPPDSGSGQNLTERYQPKHPSPLVPAAPNSPSAPPTRLDGPPVIPRPPSQNQHYQPINPYQRPSQSQEHGQAPFQPAPPSPYNIYGAPPLSNAPDFSQFPSGFQPTGPTQPSPGPTAAPSLPPSAPEPPLDPRTIQVGSSSMRPPSRGFVPRPPSTPALPVPPPGGSAYVPYRGGGGEGGPPPVIPGQQMRSKTPASAAGAGASGLYAEAPLPPGVAYPSSPISRPPTLGSLGGESAAGGPSSANAGMTPAAFGRPQSLRTSVTGASIPETVVADGGREGKKGKKKSKKNKARVQEEEAPQTRPTSSYSHGLERKPSYSKFDPKMYNDPAFLSSNESLVDPHTVANTSVNAAGRGAAGAPKSPYNFYANLPGGR
ncbi:hypothetical protein CONPUDRAFT_161505 [Coniophora puteana RWD-64-598 SS2]|uniref:Uncharacterized protein n=1 Tax=Coniophora puteana (strain RWD-64-598) TaxID=741705 RepID=A0A5M3N615_CONPW|nr:uncharacterized protein CONPUDRAFT_161505 [Coniophora puteana RWD-64-598 SS2]EIW86872.1 hypothetical protein CONPUDRAFT_161505 [Coniophora puteana RWD-64-598 SS2]